MGQSSRDNLNMNHSEETYLRAGLRYWHLWKICLGDTDTGVESIPLAIARDYLKKSLFLRTTKPLELSGGPHELTSDIKVALLSNFWDPQQPAVNRAQAGLCLRCTISESILGACKKISGLFGSQAQFRYQDLVPFVLNDDGQGLLCFEENRETLIQVHGDRPPILEDFQVFAMEILQTFSPGHKSRMSLESWVYLKTKRHPELKGYLSEFGFSTQSDWALMNRARVHQINQLSSRDRYLLKSYHAIYRRDRCQSLSPCQNPTSEQLQEMQSDLLDRDITIDASQLMRELRNIATQLRQYDIWQSRESLEVYCSESDEYIPHPELPSQTLAASDLEQQDIKGFLQAQLETSLQWAIAIKVKDHLDYLRHSKAYSAYTSKFIPGLLCYYQQGLTLRDIAAHLNMNNWDHARRILNPGKLLRQIRLLTVEKMLGQVLRKAREMELTSTPPDPDYLQNLLEQIESYADAEIFQAASEEIRVGKKTRTMNSHYAQHLLHFLRNYSPTP